MSGESLEQPRISGAAGEGKDDVVRLGQLEAACQGVLRGVDVSEGDIGPGGQKESVDRCGRPTAPEKRTAHDGGDSFGGRSRVSEERFRRAATTISITSWRGALDR